MAEYDRNKIYSKKKFHPARIKESPSQNRSFSGNKSEGKSSRESTKDSSTFEITPKKQPTILLKAREPTSDDIGTTSKRNTKEELTTNITIQPPLRDNEVTSVPTLRCMTKSLKLIDDGMICTDSLQDYMSENNEFLTVGIIGSHGVGKSTIMNLLTQNQITEQMKNSIFKFDKKFDDQDNDIRILTDHLEKVELRDESKVNREIFKTQTIDDIEKAMSRTQGIDIYITSNRLILLDCQPFASVSLLEDLIKSESKRTNLVSEFIPLENSGEIQGLQLTTFLMSVCHVLLLVEDWFLDSNIVRFIQTAEMLKPTISNPEDELMDHFPHLLIIHNKSQMEDFSPAKFRTIQQAYKMLFHKTKLNLKSDLGMGTGGLINYLNGENCGSPINLFLIPEIIPNSNQIYSGHPPLEEIIKKLRANIWGSSRNPLTHVQLTEKTWLVYCAKVWDTVKKSSFFVEYTKLMP
ncbi:unnamed protein product [Phaedon cochleariae]|uniref:KAP NTPase domain-containing protein n=1 Tax=Phaedon cochleariae TaxID=80249 RepID=A0A9P0DIW1_PHACE|nr:unnamed protein product [Phaedon cochleariae]